MQRSWMEASRVSVVLFYFLNLPCKVWGSQHGSVLHEGSDMWWQERDLALAHPSPLCLLVILIARERTQDLGHVGCPCLQIEPVVGAGDADGSSAPILSQVTASPPQLGDWNSIAAGREPTRGSRLPDVFQTACSDAFFSYLSHICLPRRVLTSQGDFGTVSTRRDGEGKPAAPCPCTSPASRSLSQQLFCSASAISTLRPKSFCPTCQLCLFSLALGVTKED